MKKGAKKRGMLPVDKELHGELRKLSDTTGITIITLSNRAIREFLAAQKLNASTTVNQIPQTV